MIGRGIVINNDGHQIQLRMQPSAACKGCTACFLDKDKLQVLQLQQQSPVKTGEVVEVEITPSFALKSAFLLFFLPLLMLILGYFVFQSMFDIPGLNEVYQGIIGAVIALVFTFVGIHYYDKHLQKSGSGKNVKIVRIVS